MYVTTAGVNRLNYIPILYVEFLLHRPEVSHYPAGVTAGVYDIDRNNVSFGARCCLVHVESTKLKGMTDFIETETIHWMMRSNIEVAHLVTDSLTIRKFYIKNE